MRGGEYQEPLAEFASWIEAFYELSTDRHVVAGFSHQMSCPIPWTAINTWAQANGIKGDTDLFTDCIRAMDAEYLAFANEQPDKRRTVADKPISVAEMAKRLG